MWEAPLGKQKGTLLVWVVLQAAAGWWELVVYLKPLRKMDHFGKSLDFLYLSFVSVLVVGVGQNYLLELAAAVVARIVEYYFVMESHHQKDYFVYYCFVEEQLRAYQMHLINHQDSK